MNKMIAMSKRSSTEDVLNRLMRRCVECPNDTPVCPKCAETETCTLRQQTCDKCRYMECISIRNIPGQQQPETKSTSIGPIVGGAVGGVTAISVVIFLVWWFGFRGKRRRDSRPALEKSYDGGADQPLRPGINSRNSIASTVLTRASRSSNVIQIAYIPGVTNTPEVPAVPSTYTSTTANSTPNVEEFRFMPSRDSTWSDNTSIASDRISIAPSLFRGSVATDIYRNDAMVPPVPAQYAWQHQANVVSVRSGSTTPNTGRNSPAPPNHPRVQQLQQKGGPQIVARNVTARPVEIRRNNSSGGVPTMANLAAANKKEVVQTRKVNTPSISDEKEVVYSPTTTLFDESPTSPLPKPKLAYGSDNGSTSEISAVLPAHGPLGSSSVAAQQNGNNTTADISAMILNAMKSASQNDAHAHQRPELSKHDSGPFSDSNEIKENRSP